MIEKALIYELNKINELENKIFPLNAPEGQKSPYLVYITKHRPFKNLNGITEHRECHFILNILCNSYSQMKYMNKNIEDIISKFPLKNIGKEKLYIEDVTFDELNEIYEDQLKLYRGIIPFTIYYKEKKLWQQEV